MPHERDFDFWDFVCCDKCHRLFLSDSGPVIPYWLTNCGHVICNTHLSPDQTCPQCGTADIQVIPLQKELDPPMATWFRSIPLALDEVAFAAKMQQESMAAHIRKLRHRDQQMRSAVERLKHDVFELKKFYHLVLTIYDPYYFYRRINEEVVHENNEFRRQLNLDQPYREGVSSETRNSNGKRPMVTSPYNAEHRSASPRTVTTPIGQSRITLPPNQQAPDFSSSNQPRGAAESSRSPFKQSGQQQQQKPPSSYLVQQYAYKPPATPRQQLSSLNYQAGPGMQAQPAAQQISQSLHSLYQSTSRALSMHSKFRPAPSGPTQTGSGGQAPLTGPSQTLRNNENKRVMGPPPTPQHVRHQRSIPLANSFAANGHTQSGSGDSLVPLRNSKGVNDYPATSSGQRQPWSDAAPQRFVPPTTSSGSQTRGVAASEPRAPSRMSIPGGGNQRVPFSFSGDKNSGNFG